MLIAPCRKVVNSRCHPTTSPDAKSSTPQSNQIAGKRRLVFQLPGQNHMNRRQWLVCALLVIAVVLTRFLFRSHYLYDIDSVNFALALDHFDPTVYQPHPPGYFLYVILGRLANAIFNDANTALVAISIAASAAAAFLIYVLTENWFGRK